MKCFPSALGSLVLAAMVLAWASASCGKKDEGGTPAPGAEAGTKAGESAAGAAAGAEAKPGEAAPGAEAKPGEAAPGTEAKPGEAAPDTEAKPGEAAPGTEATPAEAAPAGTAPAADKDTLAKAYVEIYCAQRKGETEKLLEIYSRYGFQDPKAWTDAWTEAAKDSAWVAKITQDAIKACP